MRQALVSGGISILVLVLALGGFQGFMSTKEEPKKLENIIPIKSVKTTAISNATTNSQIPVTGRLVARDRIEVFAEVGGTYLGGAKSFKEGNYFKKGETLIEIDNEEFKLSLQAQKSQLLNQITLLLPDLKTDYAKSFPAWQEYLNSFDVNEPIKAMPEPQNEQERYFLSARNIYNLYYSIKSQEVRLSKYVIKAPFSGKVSQSSMYEGMLVRAGQPIGQFINPYSYELEAAVSLEELAFVRPGSKVSLLAEELGTSYKGTVARISDVIDAQTQTVKVFVQVGGSNLKEGMYLQGTIQGQALKSVVEIPRAALLGDTAIWVVEDSLLKPLSVRPLQITASSATVKGIPDGTVVVSESIIGAFEGMRVNPYQ